MAWAKCPRSQQPTRLRTTLESLLRAALRAERRALTARMPKSSSGSVPVLTQHRRCHCPLDRAGANWEQVFGRRVHLWPLPLYGAGPAGNGVSWPISPKIAAGLPTGARSPPARGAVRARWGSVLWAPLWAAQHGQSLLYRWPPMVRSALPLRRSNPLRPESSMAAYAPQCSSWFPPSWASPQDVSLAVFAPPGGAPVGALVLLWRLQCRHGAADTTLMLAGAIQLGLPPRTYHARTARHELERRRRQARVGTSPRQRRPGSQSSK